MGNLNRVVDRGGFLPRTTEIEKIAPVVDEIINIVQQESAVTLTDGASINLMNKLSEAKFTNTQLSLVRAYFQQLINARVDELTKNEQFDQVQALQDVAHKLFKLKNLSR